MVNKKGEIFEVGALHS